MAVARRTEKHRDQRRFRLRHRLQRPRTGEGLSANDVAPADEGFPGRRSPLRPTIPGHQQQLRVVPLPNGKPRQASSALKLNAINESALHHSRSGLCQCRILRAQGRRSRWAPRRISTTDSTPGSGGVVGPGEDGRRQPVYRAGQSGRRVEICSAKPLRAMEAAESDALWLALRASSASWAIGKRRAALPPSCAAAIRESKGIPGVLEG